MHHCFLLKFVHVIKFQITHQSSMSSSMRQFNQLHQLNQLMPCAMDPHPELEESPKLVEIEVEVLIEDDEVLAGDESPNTRKDSIWTLPPKGWKPLPYTPQPLRDKHRHLFADFKDFQRFVQRHMEIRIQKLILARQKKQKQIQICEQPTRVIRPPPRVIPPPRQFR